MIPLVNRLKKHSTFVGARALIIVPTRELALQTLNAMKDMGKFTNLRNTLLVGGYGYEGQFESIASNPDVVIATPGRLMEILEQTEFELKKVEYLVFDEADILFEMGFNEQIQKILKGVSQNRQTLLFSATIPKQLTDFAIAGLNDYRLLRIDTEYMMPEKALLHFVICRSAEKLATLCLLLQRFVKGKTILFCPTRQVVEYLESLLPLLQVKTISIYGKMEQRARKMLMDEFKEARGGTVLVVTDLAARGLDIPDVEHVVNFGFPQMKKNFVHRCGRTARAGQPGTAWSIFDLTEKTYIGEVGLNLDRELVNKNPGDLEFVKDADGNPLFDPVRAYYGRIGHEFTTEFAEVIIDATNDNEDLFKLKEAMDNSMKKFLRSREKTTPAGAKYLNNLDLNAPHPLFVPKNEETHNLLQRITNFKPERSYMELEKVKEGARKDDKVLNVIKKMKSKTVKSHKNKKRREREKNQEDQEKVAYQQYEMEREENQKNLDIANEAMKDKYKSSLFISNQPNEELRQEFFKKENMTLDDLEAQVMDKDNQQLFERRKYIWDPRKREYKKLKVNYQGKVIREDGVNKIKGDRLKERFKRWKKFTNIGIQKQGEEESVSMTKKARTMLVKRTINRHTKHSIMASTKGIFKVKKKKKLKLDLMERRGGKKFKKRKKAGGGGRKF